MPSCVSHQAFTQLQSEPELSAARLEMLVEALRWVQTVSLSLWRPLGGYTRYHVVWGLAWACILASLRTKTVHVCCDQSTRNIL